MTKHNVSRSEMMMENMMMAMRMPFFLRCVLQDNHFAVL